MKRGYTALEYKSIVRRLRAARPDLSLTSDFIVGFPGETDARLRADAEAGRATSLRRRVQLPVQPAAGHARRRACRPGAARRRSRRGSCGCRRVLDAQYRALQRSDGRHAPARAGHRPRRQGRRRAAGAHRQQPRRQFPRRRRPSSTRTSTSRSPPRCRTRCAATARNSVAPRGALFEARGVAASPAPRSIDMQRLPSDRTLAIAAAVAGRLRHGSRSALRRPRPRRWPPRPRKRRPKTASRPTPDSDRARRRAPARRARQRRRGGSRCGRARPRSRRSRSPT